MLSGCDTKEAAIEKLLSAGAKNLILTEGKHGSGCYNKDGFITAPAFPVEAVDTTGAGDTFTAGLLHAMTEGFEIQQALRFAAACAAEAVKVVGARTSMPTAEKMAAVWPALNGSDPE
jgi:ribokinase